MNPKIPKTGVLIAVFILAFSAFVYGITPSETKIYVKFAAVPSFDGLRTNVLGHPDLDVAVHDTLVAYGCISLSKRFVYRMNDNFAKWYTAEFSTPVNINGLYTSLKSINALAKVQYDNLGLDASPFPLSIEDPLYPDMSWIFELLTLDSALSVEQGDASIIIGIEGMEKPFEWNHPDLAANVWVNNAEDINQNGRLDDWSSTSSNDGVFGDYDGLDNDADGLIDNVLGAGWSLDSVSAAKNNGYDHETEVAGVAAALANTIGSLGSCPQCKLMTLRNSPPSAFDDDLVWAISHGAKVINRSWSTGLDGSPGTYLSDIATEAVIELDSIGGVFLQGSGNFFQDKAQMLDTNRNILLVSGFQRDFRVPPATFSGLVDFCAPFAGYHSTEPRGGYTDSRTSLGGTSFSTPLMAGAVALMFAYSQHHQRHWTTDSIINRLAWASTRLEQKNSLIGPAYGKMGAGFPNVFQAMTWTGSYNTVSLDNIFVALRNNSTRNTRFPTGGDTMAVWFSAKSSNFAYDSVQFTLFSLDIYLSPIRVDVTLGPLQRGSALSCGTDTLLFIIPSQITPSIDCRLQIIGRGFGTIPFVDTFWCSNIRPTPPVHVCFTRSQANCASFGAYYCTPRFVNWGNVDADSNPEAVFYLADSLYCIDLVTKTQQFSPKPCSWVTTLPQMISAPSLGDLDGDGIDEIVYINHPQRMRAVTGTGSTVSGWDPEGVLIYPTETAVPPVLCDVNLDGKLEAVLCAKAKIFAVSSTGASLQGYPVTFAGVNDRCIPAVGDVTGDGLPEIIFTTTEGYLYVYRAKDGVLEWSDQSGKYRGCIPQIGDIDCDGLSNIIIPTPSAWSEKCAWLLSLQWDSTEAIVKTKDTLSDVLTPQKNPLLGSEVDFGNYGLFDNFAQADIDVDGFPNTVVPVTNKLNTTTFLCYFNSVGLLHTWAGFHERTLLPGEVELLFLFRPTSPLILGSLNGDTHLDALISQIDSSDGILAFDLENQSIHGEPDAGLIWHADQRGTPLITSWAAPTIIPNGNQTLVTEYLTNPLDTRNTLVFYSLPGANPHQEWPLWRHDRYLSGCYRTQYAGTLAQSQVWRDTVYLVGDVVVPVGKTLTINPGTVLLSLPGDRKNAGSDAARCELVVRGGSLNVNGSASRRVQLAGTSTAKGSWYGVVIDSGIVKIRYADITGAYTGIFDKGHSLDSVVSCKVSNCQVNGIKTRNSNLVVVNSRIEGVSPGYGVYVDSCNATFRYDTVSTCETGFYLNKVRQTLGDCLVTGSGGYIGINAQGPGSTDTLFQLKLINVTVSGSYSVQGNFDEHWVTIDTCVFDSPTSGSRSSYGLIGVFHDNTFKVRNSLIRYHGAADIYASISNTSAWDFGKDSTGKYGNNWIYTDAANALFVDGESWGTLNAQRNYWGSSPDSSKFQQNGGFTVSWLPRLIRPPMVYKFANEGEILPTTYELYQNYPNPFNPSTMIAFQIPEMAHVTLDVYNILGQRIVRLVDAPYAPGNYRVLWDGRNSTGILSASGVYFYRISTKSYTNSKKMLMVK